MRRSAIRLSLSGWFRSPMMMFAPRLAQWRAKAAPRPEAPPVMRMVEPDIWDESIGALRSMGGDWMASKAMLAGLAMLFFKLQIG